MTRHSRWRHGERGQTGVEFMLLGLTIVAITAAFTTLAGGYLAVTYDQHHSKDPLASASVASPTPEPPSVVFVDFSPVGLYESCILKVAGASGLSWDGGELGWSAASAPRPLPSDPAYTSKLRTWRSKMTGLLSAAQNSADWQACLKPDLKPPPPTSPEPTDESVVVDGTYTIDSQSVQAIGGCGSDNPTSMTVSGNGSTATVYFGSRGETMKGTLDTSSNSINLSRTDSNGAQYTVRGNFSSNAGVTRFSGEYEILRDTAGCGYQYSAQKS